MALLLTELMAEKGARFHELVERLLATLGTLEYARRDLSLAPGQKDALIATHIASDAIPADTYCALFAPLDEQLVSVERTDGIKFDFASDGWLLVRPSGTEPLVRVYAEATTPEQVEALLDFGCTLAQGDILQ
jgi:phosphomannomutase